MLRLEGRQARHQPADREARPHLHAQRQPGAEHLVGAAREPLERGADEGQVGLRGLGELETPAAAAEELRVQVALEQPDLLADGGLRDPQLLRRAREALQARGGLEGTQRAQGRQGLPLGQRGQDGSSRSDG
jgi:hypothetical protein